MKFQNLMSNFFVLYNNKIDDDTFDKGESNPFENSQVLPLEDIPDVPSMRHFLKYFPLILCFITMLMT